MRNFRALLLVVLIISTGSALGQTVYGLKAGVCLPKLRASVSSSSGSGSATSDALTTFTGGLFLRMQMSPKVAFQPEFLYAQMGAAHFLPGVDLKMTYISVPLMFKFSGGSPINFQIGPQLSYLYESYLGGTKISSGFNQFDFTGAFGIGYDSHQRISIDFRYLIGITNILDTTGAPAGTNISMTHQALQLTLGIVLSAPPQAVP